MAALDEGDYATKVVEVRAERNKIPAPGSTIFG